MKNYNKLSIVICCILMSCIFMFAGCTPLYINNFNFKEYTSNEITNEELFIDTEGLSLQEKKTKIAEEYISISFTVIIAKKVETVVYTSLGIEKSKTEDETFASFGSGTIVHKGGYILTNYHVINSALAEPSTVNSTNSLRETIKTTTSYVVYVSQDGGETCYEAQILWTGLNFDLAIIVCSQFADLSAAPLKDRSVYCSSDDRIKVLEEVITIGTQYNQENYGSATTGTISSSVMRSIYGSDLQLNYEYLIQHDAAINHGNSGGALIDMDGYLIGINTLGVDNANSLFYAVSVYPIISILPIVVENWENNAQKTTDVSIGLSAVDKLMAKNLPSSLIETGYEDFSKDGVIVTKVEETCIIENIQKDDIIKEVKFTNGTDTETFTINNVYDFLYARLRLHKYNSAIVTIERNGETLQLNLTK